MDGLNNFDWANAPATALLAVSMVAAFVFIWRMMLVTKDMQANALGAGTAAIKEALDAFKQAQNESRIFYTGKLEDMRAGQSLTEGRVRDLEAEVESLKEKNEDLVRENRRKDQRIAELEEEIDVLRKRLDEKSKPKSPRDAKPSRSGGARIAGDK